MIVTSLLATLLLATAGCPANADSAGNRSESAETRPTVLAGGLVQLSGFVELYPDASVLLTEGREIALVGPAHLIELRGGLESAVRGRFIDKDVFLVESIGPAASPVLVRSHATSQSTQRVARER